MSWWFFAIQGLGKNSWPEVWTCPLIGIYRVSMMSRHHMWSWQKQHFNCKNTWCSHTVTGVGRVDYWPNQCTFSITTCHSKNDSRVCFRNPSIKVEISLGEIGNIHASYNYLHESMLCSAQYVGKNKWHVVMQRWSYDSHARKLPRNPAFAGHYPPTHTHQDTTKQMMQMISRCASRDILFARKAHYLGKTSTHIFLSMWQPQEWTFWSWGKIRVQKKFIFKSFKINKSDWNLFATWLSLDMKINFQKTFWFVDSTWKCVPCQKWIKQWEKLLCLDMASLSCLGN